MIITSINEAAHSVAATSTHVAKLQFNCSKGEHAAVLVWAAVGFSGTGGSQRFLDTQVHTELASDAPPGSRLE